MAHDVASFTQGVLTDFGSDGSGEPPPRKLNCLLAACLCLCEAIGTWGERPWDTPEDRNVRRLSAPVVFVIGAASALMGGLSSATWGVWSVGTWCAVAVMGSTNIAFGLGKKPLPVLSACMLGCTVCIILADWGLAQALYPRMWGLVMVVLDCALVTDAAQPVQIAIVTMTVLWLTVERTEAAERWGLLRIAYFDGNTHVDLCDCAEPPCRRDITDAGTGWLFFVLLFLCDFWFTRGFAKTMRRQMQVIDASVAVSGRIAELLADYDVEEARRAVDSEQGSKLPRDLSHAYRRLLLNLETYRPFLPESILYGAGLEEGGDTWAPDGGECTAPADIPPPGVDKENPHVCVCFTDIQSSSILWEHHPQGMYDALRAHNSVLRQAIARHGGYEVKTIGDSFMVVFGSAAQGIAAALEAQEQLVSQDWPADLCKNELCRPQRDPAGAIVWNGLRVRSGLHYGPVRVEMNPVTGRADYFGPVVNIAARVEAMLRYGGLTGTTSDALAAVSGSVMEQLGLPIAVPLGPKELRGIALPVPITVLLPSRLAARKPLAIALRDGWDLTQRRGSPAPDNTTLVLLNTTETETASEGSDCRGTMNEHSSNSSAPRGRPVGRAESSSSIASAPESPAVGTTMDSFRKALLPGGNLPANQRTALQLRRVPASCVAARAAFPSQTMDQVLNMAAAAEHAADVAIGVVEHVMSSVVLISWNTSRPCVDHAGQAAHCLKALGGTAVARISGLCFHAGAASGHVLWGNVGGARRRYATVAGRCVELAAALSEEAALCGDAALTIGLVAQHCAATRSAKRAQVWQVQGEHEHLVVWEVLPLAAELKWDMLLGPDLDPAADCGALPQPWAHEAAFAAAAALPPEVCAAALQELAVRHPGDEELARLAARAARGAVRRRTVAAPPDPAAPDCAPFVTHLLSRPWHSDGRSAASESRTPSVVPM
eukprot:TRINITY_DN2503_c1_g4_i1.p1 TRINITY_DN2503_c1_g4~~TRINITY_DN2503_c1_g4_i1.p1  ORF type:complete len:975 (+),score=250.89 TRINITY_DN2503_c1_g4_i1:98-2926(+)